MDDYKTEGKGLIVNFSRHVLSLPTKAMSEDPSLMMLFIRQCVYVRYEAYACILFYIKHNNFYFLNSSHDFSPNEADHVLI